MLRNRLIIKKIRNICILLMAIIIMIGVYTNIRRSRAENVIQIALEVSDKSEALEMQTIMVDATETQDGNYLLDLPTSVNGNIVTKYYTADGTEVLMNDENADKTLTLTEAEVSEQKIQLQTDYDKKEVTTEDGQTITLYNKELMDVKEPEENAEEGTNNTDTNETETNETLEEGTTEETNLDDSVVVTGYMPLEAQVDINEIDLATLSDIQLPSDTQTMQKAYEVSVYQTFRTTIDADGNAIAEEIEMPQSQMDNGTNNETEENTTNNTTDNMAIENINSENARENENVQSVIEGTTPDNTTITTITLKDGTTIEEEKIEYDPSIYNEELTIKTKNTEANTTATVYGIQENNQIQALENIIEEEYINAAFSKNSQTVKYIVATEPSADSNNVQSDSEVSTMALTDGNYLRATNTENRVTSGFLGNTSIRRQNIDNVTFVSSTSGMNSTAWDVSEAQDGSIMAWYTTNSNGTYKVYIGSDETIYANPDSSYLFANIGYSSNCTATETITNIELLNTSNVTNMYMMFFSTGYTAMTSLDLGDNFDTSNVTMMWGMFFYTGYTAMTSLDLGDNFDTSNVINMQAMFSQTGYTAMTSLDLGDKFDTSNVIEMSEMFSSTGYTAMTSLDLRDKFDTSSVTMMYFMFSHTGYRAMTSLDLGNNFNTSNVINMQAMFSQTGYTAMTSLDLGDKFDTSNVIDMSEMFSFTGLRAMTSLNLGDKFDTSKVTNMNNMFDYTGELALTSLDLGPAFTKIATTNTDMFYHTGKSGCAINAPEAIYQNSTNFKLNTNSSTTISFTRGTINPKYRTEWTKQAVEADTTQASNPKLKITLKGTTNPEVDASEYASDVTSSLTASNIKILIDDTDVTNIIAKSLGSSTRTYNSKTGKYDVTQVLTLSDFEEATIRTGKSYKEWSGNIRVEIPQGTLKDTYGNSNIGLETDGSRTDNVIEDATKLDKNTTNGMFMDYIKPGLVYNYSSTDIDHDTKTLTVDFSVTDKYFNSSTISSNAANITVKMLDTNVVPENLTKSLRKVQDITETRNGSSVKVGEKYRLVISGFEQASIENGKYKEYSGPVSIVFPAGMATDKSGNSSVQTNITVGISEPNHDGNQQIVDFIEPGIEKISSTVNIVKDGTAELVFQVTDKYLSSNTLSSGSLQVLVNGEVNTSITKQLTSTNLTEQRVENGTTSSVRYGTEYTLTLTGIGKTNINQIKVRIPAGTFTDTSGNGNKEVEFMVYNALRNIGMERDLSSSSRHIKPT